MYFITSFKQYSSLERQKRNKKNTCNTSFSLKRMGWQKKLDLITYSSLGFTKSETGSTWKILRRVGCGSQKRWMGAYWKLYLHGWVSLDLNEVYKWKSLANFGSFIWSFHWADYVFFFYFFQFCFAFFFWILLYCIIIFKLGLMKFMLAISR